jgi:hypothetical protein
MSLVVDRHIAYTTEIIAYYTSPGFQYGGNGQNNELQCNDFDNQFLMVSIQLMLEPIGLKNYGLSV